MRILSYNIHHGEGLDKKCDLGRIAKVINKLSPDVVSLQEVDKKTRRSKGIDQAKELARLTKMNFVYGASISYDGGTFGNAVLTKLTIEESKVIPLPGEPRSALCVTLKTAGEGSSSGRVLFIATHLDTKKRPRLRSVPLIENLFHADKDLPAILAGDLNASPDSLTIRALEKTWKNTAPQRVLFTFPAKHPSRQLDYILCRPGKNWRCVQTEVLDDVIASDHRPIFAVLHYSKS